MYTYNRMLLSHNNEINSVICTNMDGPLNFDSNTSGSPLTDLP